MKHLFGNWPDILTQLSQAEQILLLLDYDGSLTPIAPTPDEAVLNNEMRKLLESLTKKEGFRLGIISGRKLAEVQSLVGVSGIYYAGNHGLEMEGPDVHYTHPEGEHARPYLTAIYQALSEGLSQMEGIVLEDKTLSLSLHYRLVDDSYLPRVRQVFDQVCGLYARQGQIKVTEGKRVLEVRPWVDWDKGKAVLMLKDLIGRESTLLTIYVGDDRTDEDAFSVLKSSADISILVGDSHQESRAKYYVADVGEVTKFLHRLKGILKN